MYIINIIGDTFGSVSRLSGDPVNGRRVCLAGPPTSCAFEAGPLSAPTPRRVADALIAALLVAHTAYLCSYSFRVFN